MTSERKVLPKAKDWAEAEALWANGDSSRKEIAEKLGVSETAVQKHMKRASIQRGSGSGDHKAKVAEEVQQQAITDASVHAQRIRETKEQHYAMASNIARLAWNEVIAAQRNKTPFAAIAPNIKALDLTMTVLARARMERWAVLGLDRPDAVDTNELAILEIQELTAEEIEELRERNFNEFDDELAEDDEAEIVQETVEVN